MTAFPSPLIELKPLAVKLRTCDRWLADLAAFLQGEGREANRFEVRLREFLVAEKTKAETQIKYLEAIKGN